MRGRRVLMESFVLQGVRHIFGNPGTTETPLLDSLPAYPQIDYVMTLHEGVAVGKREIAAARGKLERKRPADAAGGAGHGGGGSRDRSL